MAASVRASATYATTAAAEASCTVPLPSGWAAGDVCYVFAGLRAATGALGAAPTGWVNILASFHAASSTSSEAAVYRRVLQAGDAAPVITGTSGRFGCVSTAVQGADGTTPEDGVTIVTDAGPASAPASPYAMATSSITPASASDLLLVFWSAGTSTSGATITWSTPAGMSVAAQVSSAVATATNASSMAASLALSAATATGAQSSTATTSSGTLAPQAVTLVVRSAAGAPASLLPQQVRMRYPAITLRLSSSRSGATYGR